MSEVQGSVILVGRKPPVNYVLAMIEAFNVKGLQEVVVKARGRAICKAVDVIDTVKSKYFKDIYVKSFDARYEEVEGEKGNKVRVASVEIVVARGGGGQQAAAQAQPQPSSPSSPSGA